MNLFGGINLALTLEQEEIWWLNQVKIINKKQQEIDLLLEK